MKIIRRIIFIIALLVFIGSAGYLGLHYFEGQQTENAFRQLTVDGGHDLAALHEQNPDIVGWIKIDDTRVDYPVMWTPDDPEFYLRRNFQKEDSVAGTPFLDAASTMPGSSNWLIYGHNMKNGTMFHDTLKYEDKAFYDGHKTIHFDTLEGEGLYEIVAVCYTQIYEENAQVFKYYQYASIVDEASFNAYVQGVKALSIYDTGVTPVWGDQLITLSTCEYSVEDGRFIIVARKVQ
jgi:sortase B